MSPRLPFAALSLRPLGATLVLCGIVVLGIALRCGPLSTRSFWFDEAFSWRMTQFPVPEMLARTARDNHPPLYFLLLRGWATLFGESAISLRALSVALGVLAIVGMYLFVTEAFTSPERDSEEQGRFDSRRMGLFVAGLVALSVFQIRWSWEVRMYALGTALVAFSSWTMFRALHAPPHDWRPWVVYGFTTLLFAYTHYYAFFSIASQVLFLVGFLLVRVRGSLIAAIRNPLGWRILSAGLIVLLGWLPWLPFFLGQRAQVKADFWSRAVSAWDLPNACYEMFVDPEDAVFFPWEAGVVGGLCAAGLLALLWRARAGSWYVFAAAVTPAALAVLVSLIDTKVFHLRYLLFAHLFLLAGLGVLLGRIPYPLERNLFGALVMANFFYADICFWQKLDVANKPGARAAAEWVARQRQPEEVVVVSSPLLYFSVLFHAGDRSGWYLYTDGQPVVHYEGVAVLTPDDLITRQQMESLPCQRIWAVDMTGGNWGERIVPVPPNWTAKQVARFPEVYRVQGTILVTEYHLPPERDRATTSLHKQAANP